MRRTVRLILVLLFCTTVGAAVVSGQSDGEPPAQAVNDEGMDELALLPLAEQELLADELLTQIEEMDDDALEPMEALYIRLINEAPATLYAEYAYWLLSNMYMRAFSPARHADAASLLEQYLERYPDSLFLDQLFPVFARPGISLVQRRLLVLYDYLEAWEKAAALYDRLIPDPTDVAPSLVGHLLLYGDTMQRVSRIEEAIDAYQTYLRRREGLMPALRDAAQRRLIDLGAEPVPEDELADAPAP